MRRAVWAVLLLVAALLATSCSSSSSPVGAGQGFARRGPDAVGVTTLDLGSTASLGERLVTVFYPADASKAPGHPRFSYHLSDPLPRAVLAIVPPKYDAVISVDARVDAPGAQRGPYPVVLFSHGFGASRLFYSELLSGIASWGFVVVSADYLERGLLSQAVHSTIQDSPSIDQQTLFSSLDAARSASADPTSPLHGVADFTALAVVGHSAGGQVAFDALTDPRVRTAVGWAPVGPSGAPSRKPVTIIGARQDVALTPTALTKEFHRFRGPTSLVEISGEGHNTFTDLCPSIRGGGGGLIGFAIALHLISGELAKLGVNGCTARNLPAQRFWPIVQSYTVTALRNGLGIGSEPLRAANAGAFPGFTVSLQQHR